ncbi:MAG TPA: hypothetical protein VMA73_24750 [Streptosporangiaceae bacterium]|nr:hypothetical protein [Streptosporangiaceae bacterium]
MTGRVMARPVRIGLVFEPSAEVLRSAVEEATLLWGGQYQPFFRPGDLDQIERLSRRLGLDVLLAFDRTGASEEAAALDGFQWQGREGWGPLAPAQDYVNHRLLGPERVLDELRGDSWVLPDWAADDPLADLFQVWFGLYGASAQGLSLKEQFAVRAAQVRIDDGAEVPTSVGSWITPITVTGSAIEYMGISPGPVFVVVDPCDPESLMALWNARACGGHVFPIPVGHEERILPAAESWLERLLADGELRRWMAGDGTPAGPRISVWEATDSAELPARLVELLGSHDVTPMVVPSDFGLDGAYGWRGDHPFTTGYAQSFAQPLESDGRVARIPVPGVGGGVQGSRGPCGDIVAVQVEISGSSGVRPDWTFSVPNKRSYARVLLHYDGVLLSFIRPVAEGLVLSASSGTREVLVSAVPSSTILDKMIEGTGWSAHQTPGGVFMTRFIERLGGPGSTLANQPGARAALLDVAGSQQGRPSGAIVESVKRWRASWPEPLAGNAEGYPAAVFQFLLRQAILRPVLPIECPHCTSLVVFRPEDLATQMKCEMCLREFPLGLAMGMKPGRRNEWRYQLAGHVGTERLREALPVMASLQVLCSGSPYRESMIPYVLGWAVKGPNLDCEVDLAAVLDYRGMPVVVIGEIKSRQGAIDLNDLEKLRQVQQQIRGRGVECFVMAAVMRELSGDETRTLREFARRPPRTLPADSAIEQSCRSFSPSGTSPRRGTTSITRAPGRPRTE